MNQDASASLTPDRIEARAATIAHLAGARDKALRDMAEARSGQDIP